MLITGGLEALKQNFISRGDNWIMQNLNNLVVYKVSTNSSSSLVVTHSIGIKNDLSWQLFVHGFLVNPVKCGLLSDIPKKMCSKSLEQLLDKCHICPGNPDNSYIEMVETKKGQLMSKGRQAVTAKIYSFSPVFLKGERYIKTVRVSSCQLLVEGNRCSTCISYRDSLRSMYSPWLKQKSL